MPLIERSSYRAPWYLFGGHLQTIVPNRIRRVRGVGYVQETVPGPNGDIELYVSRVGARRVAVVAHGLAGHVHRPYMLGMVRALNRAGWDAVAWPVWGTSTSGREAPHFYHSGTTGEVREIVRRLAGDGTAVEAGAGASGDSGKGETGGYDSIGLIGFSMGGNVILKYLGEEGPSVDPRIVGAATVSVPCDLASSARIMDKRRNRIYRRRFMRCLRAAVRRKAEQMPGAVNTEGLDDVDDFVTYDERYTAPLNGFRDAADYYATCSSRAYLPEIRIPALIVNARNDSFLAEACYPVCEAARHGSVWLEMPEKGGHLGFWQGIGRPTWVENRIPDFLTSA